LDRVRRVQWGGDRVVLDIGLRFRDQPNAAQLF
jgi:hypothetical protein